MKQVINGIVAAHVDVVFRTANNFHAKITVRDAEHDVVDLALYPNITWTFYSRYNKSDIKLLLSINNGIAIIDKVAHVFIGQANLPKGEALHEFKLSSTMDVMAGKALTGNYYQDSFLQSYSHNASVEGMTIDVYGDIVESQFIDLNLTDITNLALDKIYKVQEI